MLLSSERLRSTRIALLKATHFPFVAAIWAYEKVMASSSKFQSGLSMSGPESLPAINKRLFRPSHQLSSMTRPTTGDPNGRNPPASTMHHQTESSLTELEPQLKSLVMKLTAQVDHLTTVVSQLQEQREATMAA